MKTSCFASPFTSAFFFFFFLFFFIDQYYIYKCVQLPPAIWRKDARTVPLATCEIFPFHQKKNKMKKLQPENGKALPFFGGSGVTFERESFKASFGVFVCV